MTEITIFILAVITLMNIRNIRTLLARIERHEDRIAELEGKVKEPRLVRNPYEKRYHAE